MIATTLSQQERMALRAAYLDFTCARCGGAVRRNRYGDILNAPLGHLEHIIPRVLVRTLSLGDENASPNLWTLCAECHRDKTAFVDSELVAGALFSVDVPASDIWLRAAVKRFVGALVDHEFPCAAPRRSTLGGLGKPGGERLSGAHGIHGLPADRGGDAMNIPWLREHVGGAYWLLMLLEHYASQSTEAGWYVVLGGEPLTDCNLGGAMQTSEQTARRWRKRLERLHYIRTVPAGRGNGNVIFLRGAGTPVCEQEPQAKAPSAETSTNRETERTTYQWAN